MRPLEIIIPVLLAAYLLWPVLFGKRSMVAELLPAAGVLLMLLHFVIEGYRWQMVPLYGLVLFFLTLSLWHLIRGGARERSLRTNRVPGAIIGLLVVAAAAALPVLLPVPVLLRPTGPYAVGTYSFLQVDTSRKELYSNNPTDPRRLMVQVWYPATVEKGSRPGRWMENVQIIGPAIVRRITSGRLELPSFFLDHLTLARTHSYPSAPFVSGDKAFPVLLFSHGWGGFRGQNTNLAEELASHGYVVFAVDHTYGAAATIFPDGEVIFHNLDTLPSDLPPAEYYQAANRLVKQWAGDLAYVLDTATTLNENDPLGRFTDRLDLERVGVFGHSTGGGAAVEFCAGDQRCKAGLGMDPYLVPVSKTVLEGGLSQPFLYMFSEYWSSDTNLSLFDELFGAEGNGSNRYRLDIAGTDHYDFTDLPLLTPLAYRLGLKGPLPSSEVLHIVDTTVLTFFDSLFQPDSQTSFPNDLEKYKNATLTVINVNPG